MSKKGEFPGVDFLGTTLKFTKRKGAFDWELKSGFRIERKIRNTFQRWDMCSWIPFLSVFFWKSEKGFEKQFQIRTVVFGFLNRTVKRKSMKSGFGILNKNPPSGRISRKWNPFLDFAFDCKKSKIRIPKSKSGFPNQTQPKENSSLLVYVLHKTWSFFTSKSCRDGREMFCFIISLMTFSLPSPLLRLPRGARDRFKFLGFN